MTPGICAWSGRRCIGAFSYIFEQNSFHKGEPSAANALMETEKTVKELRKENRLIQAHSFFLSSL